MAQLPKGEQQKTETTTPAWQMMQTVSDTKKFNAFAVNNFLFFYI